MKAVVSRTVTVTPVAGLSGFVALNCSVASSGSGPVPTCAVSPSSVLISGSSSDTATLVVTVPQGVAAGSYSVTLTATDGTATGTAAISLGVNAPFTLAASSVPATALGSTANSTITLTPNNFAATVHRASGGCCYGGRDDLVVNHPASPSSNPEK